MRVRCAWISLSGITSILLHTPWRANREYHDCPRGDTVTCGRATAPSGAGKGQEVDCPRWRGYPVSGHRPPRQQVEHAEALTSIPKVPLPASDPVFEVQGRWSRRGEHDVGLARLLERRPFDLRQWAPQGRALSAHRGGDRRAGARTRCRRALDYGCGEALHADRVAAVAARSCYVKRRRAYASASIALREERQDPRGRARRGRVFAGALARSHPAALGRAIP